MLKLAPRGARARARCVALATASRRRSAAGAAADLRRARRARAADATGPCASDPANRGLRLGWSRGGFGGRTVSVPNVVEPDALQRVARAAVNYDGSVAWYRTDLPGAAAGVYALSFQSANYLGDGWVDGTPLGSHHGSYLPFEFRTHARARARTPWSCGSTGATPNSSPAKAFTAPGSTGAASTAKSTVRPIGASELSQPTIADDALTRTCPTRAGRTCGSACWSTTTAPRAPSRPTGTLANGAQNVIPLSFRTGHARPRADGDRDRHGDRRRTRRCGRRRSPNLYQLDLASPGESTYVAHVGLRQLTWHGGHVYLNGALLHLHGASRPGRRRRPRRRPDARPTRNGSSASWSRSTPTWSAPSTRSTRRLLERLDARRDPRVAGHRAGRRRGQLVLDDPRLLAAAEAAGADWPSRSAMLHPSIFAWNLVGRGRRATDATRPRSNTCSTLARWLHALRPHADGRRGRLGRPSADGTPAPLYDEHRRGRRDRLQRLVRLARRTPPRSSRR